MPRDSNGNYTLPAGNPVVSGEVIATGWANPSMSDIGAELTNSLDRQGRGGMLAPFKFVDGAAGTPGMTWTNEPSTGFYRAGAADMRAVVAGIPRTRWTGTGFDVWDAANSVWVALTNVNGANFAAINAQNKFTQSQVIVNTSAGLQLWKDATPTLGARFNFNTTFADQLDISFFDGASWLARFTANATINTYANATHSFLGADVATPMGDWTLDRLEVRRNAPGFASLRISSYTSSISGTDGASLDFFEGSTPVGFIRTYRDGASTMRFSNSQDGWAYHATAGIDVFRWRQAAGLQMLAGHSIAAYAVGNAKSITMAHDGSNGFFQVGSASGGIYSYIAGVARFWVTDTSIAVPSNTSMFFGGQAGISDETNGPMFGLIARDADGWKGPMLYHSVNNSNYRSGNIYTSTTEAPASGYTAGSIWIQREA